MTLDRMFTPVDESEREAAAGAPTADGRDEKGKGAVVMPAPKHAPIPTCTHSRLGKPSATWVYRDANGWPLGLVCRFDTADGKEILPVTLWQADDGALSWRWKSWPAPRPLYGLDALVARPDVPVVVTEGEKAADAAARLFDDVVAVSPPGGSKAARKVDWSPLGGPSRDGVG